MAIYHLSAKPVSRADGRSATAASAYRACERVADERTGLVFDYTRKGTVRDGAGGRVQRELVAEGVELAAGADPAWSSREALWNSVESAAKADNARLAREVEVALPRELSRKQAEALARAMARALAAEGMCADWAVHDPGGSWSNPHAHIMCTVRPCRDGRWAERKSEKAYLVRDSSGREALMSSAEIRASGEGWAKVYKYELDGEVRQLTASQAQHWKGCARVGRDPVSRKRDLGGWDSVADVERWRESWERMCNEALERAHAAARVDCRSNAARGMEEAPTAHEGPAVTAVERAERARAERAGEPYEPVTDARRKNEAVRAANSLIATLRDELRGLAGDLRGAVAEARAEWEALRCRILGLRPSERAMARARKLSRAMESREAWLKYGPDPDEAAAEARREAWGLGDEDIDGYMGELDTLELTFLGGGADAEELDRLALLRCRAIRMGFVEPLDDEDWHAAWRITESWRGVAELGPGYAERLAAHGDAAQYCPDEVSEDEWRAWAGDKAREEAESARIAGAAARIAPGRRPGADYAACLRASLGAARAEAAQLEERAEGAAEQARGQAEQACKRAYWESEEYAVGRARVMVLRKAARAAEAEEHTALARAGLIDGPLSKSGEQGEARGHGAEEPAVRELTAVAFVLAEGGLGAEEAADLRASLAEADCPWAWGPEEDLDELLDLGDGDEVEHAARL